MNDQYFAHLKPDGFAEVVGPGENGPVVCFWAAPMGKNREAHILRNKTRAVTVCNALNSCRRLQEADGAGIGTDFGNLLLNEAIEDARVTCV